VALLDMFTELFISAMSTICPAHLILLKLSAIEVNAKFKFDFCCSIQNNDIKKKDLFLLF
jgi:hypothetical protein